MRNTPKLQDTLEIFLEELKKVDNVNESLKKIDSSIGKKIESIKSSQVRVDLSQLRTIKKDLTNKLDTNKENLEVLFRENRIELVKLQEKEKKKNNIFIRLVMVVLIVSVFTQIIYVGSVRKENQEIQEQNDKLGFYNDNLRQYLHAENHYKDYQDWLEATYEDK